MSATASTRKLLLPFVLTAVVSLSISKLVTVDEFEAIFREADFGETSTERSRHILTMAKHPDADWPRGIGHVLLAPAGTPLDSKGYHEPGGSFSPGFRSFGVSLLFFDSYGTLQQSSNSVPLVDVEQTLDTHKVAVRTAAESYVAEWALSGPGSWTLRLEQTDPEKRAGAIRISSAGPSGAPISRLYWDGNQLQINDRFFVRPHTNLAGIVFSDERFAPAIHPQSDPDTPFVWHPPEGYGSVLLLLPASANEQLLSVSASGIDKDETLPASTPTQIVVDVPDTRFSDSLQAQIMHIKAGIVLDETRPGEPGNYDLDWLRDGAYVLVTLARTGHVDLARNLADRFATEDFFGGFGAEADAPGLAIWALDEIAVRFDDPGFEQWVWTHIERKAGLILEMMDARDVISKDFAGPVVPGLRGKSYRELAVVAEPARDGLITGIMDGHRPIFYINGVSYLGLTRASAMANRLGLQDRADAFAARASQLKANWQSAITTRSGRQNARTAASALWPTEVARGMELQFTQALDRRWREHRTDTGGFVDKPLWTYFDFAEAHQWLLLGNPERSWSTLEWFWANQTSPGLYTWWEGVGEVNASGIWESARGWTHPQHVTPHYWTAAEAALLQLDMLAYEDSGAERYSIVIGAGIPAAWLDQRISVASMPMRGGELGWSWDGTDITISWRGSQVPAFRKGPAFPRSAQLLLDGAIRDVAPNQTLTDLGL